MINKEEILKVFSDSPRKCFEIIMDLRQSLAHYPMVAEDYFDAIEQALGTVKLVPSAVNNQEWLDIANHMVVKLMDCLEAGLGPGVLNSIILSTAVNKMDSFSK